MPRAVDADQLRRELLPIVGERRISQRPSDLVSYGRDMWPRTLIALAGGRATPPHLPHIVVWPESEREVAAIVRVARGLGAPIVPYGGGSGVCGGAVPLLGGITIDMKRMNAVVGVDADDMVCDVEAGANGERFERELNTRGYTLGHFPSSIYCSTVGGWLACRAAGQMSTKYGKIEDRVAGLTFVSGRGDIVHTDGPARAERGPNWSQLVVGSEGTLGIITSARLRVSPTPELRLLRGFEAESVEHGVEMIRRVMQRGLRPAVVRLYDEVDTFINHMPLLGRHKGSEEPTGGRFGAPPAPAPGGGALPQVPPRDDTAPPRRRLASRLRHGAISAVLSRPGAVNGLLAPIAERLSRHGCRLIIGLEGSRVRTEIEARLTFDELDRAGATDLGEEPGLQWLEHRYDVSYKMSPVFRAGLFVDTMEVASTWERLHDLYRSVRAAIAQHAVVMAHFSHAYHEGCSIYFTFTARADDAVAAERAYDAIWQSGMAAASRVGGTISHHHGIGLLKGPAMAAEHREAMEIFRAVKDSLDPDGILNPGKLGLPARLEAR